MPESLRALLRIVSFTAAKTRRMLDVSVACVRLHEVRLILFELSQRAELTEGKGSGVPG